ncbi:MAG: alpha/beta hydrolase fold domain-containing protein [Sphingopyxis sp.]
MAMASQALNLPGVCVTAMPRATPMVRHWLLELGVALPWKLGGWLVSIELARTAAIADPAARAERYRSLRRRFVRSEARSIAAMNIAIGDLAVDRPIATGIGFSWINGHGFGQIPVLLYVPGGSFLVPRSPHFTAMITRIARAARARVMICDYRLAPENPCPAAIDDVEAAADLLIGQGQCPENIFLVAESTGAGIALATAQRLVARGVHLGGLALLSPWIDVDPARRDINPVARQAARLYLGGADPRDPAVNPAYGPMNGLPHILIHANRHDPMFADAEMLARRAAVAGVPVDLRWWPGRMHVLERHDDPDARRSIAGLADFVTGQHYRAAASSSGLDSPRRSS